MSRDLDKALYGKINMYTYNRIYIYIKYIYTYRIMALFSAERTLAAENCTRSMNFCFNYFVCSLGNWFRKLQFGSR